MFRRLMYETGRMLRETGQAVDRVGLRALENPIYREPFSRHRAVMNLYEKHPSLSPDTFVAPNASVIGNVLCGRKTVVWYGAVIRADINNITIGDNSVVGDRAVIHTSKSVEGKDEANCEIGRNVRIGPGAMLQSCKVDDNVRIGAGAVIMDGAIVEEYSEVAEGAVVHGGRRIPSGQLWAGNPATCVRSLTKTEMADFEPAAHKETDLAEEHKAEFLPYTTVYQQAEQLGVADPRLQEIQQQQAEKDAGKENVRELTEHEIEVENVVKPREGFQPPPGKTLADSAKHREAVQRGESKLPRRY